MLQQYCKFSDTKKIPVKKLIFGTLVNDYVESDIHDSQQTAFLKIIGNKAKGQISKRVFQENKACQIFTPWYTHVSLKRVNISILSIVSQFFKKKNENVPKSVRFTKLQ